MCRRAEPPAVTAAVVVVGWWWCEPRFTWAAPPGQRSRRWLSPSWHLRKQSPFRTPLAGPAPHLPKNPLGFGSPSLQADPPPPGGISSGSPGISLSEGTAGRPPVAIRM